MTQPSRNYGFDNLRVTMVLSIVLLHAACAYAAIIPWWHAQDLKHPAFTILILILDSFALPALFFIAGLYALPSLKHHGTPRFILTKLKRLGLPLLLMIPFYLPTMVYVGYLRRTPDPLPFFRYWLHWMSTFTDWGFVLITDMTTGAEYADSAAPHHLWFLSLLLIFFLAYVGLRAVFRTRFTVPMLSLTLGATAVMGATMAVAYLLMPDWSWARLGPFLLFQPARLPIYAGMFVFGVLARPHMDRERPFPGPTWLWASIFIVSQTLILIGIIMSIASPSPFTAERAITGGILRAVIAVSAAGLLVNLFRRFLSGPARWRESLSRASYDIYIWHMPLVVYVQAALTTSDLPTPFKMLAALAAGVGGSWIISRGSDRLREAFPTGVTAACFFSFWIMA